MTDWLEITKRNARSVQTTIGWIFWDPGAVARYEALGLPGEFVGPLGYIGARCAPFAGAGPDAVIAAFGTISPLGIRAVFDLASGEGTRTGHWSSPQGSPAPKPRSCTTPLGYEQDWLPRSRGATEEDLDAGWALLATRGLAQGRVVTDAGVALRQHLEDETDRLTTLRWELLGEERSRWFAEAFEPPCEALLRRVDETAGPNYQPASRVR